MPYEEGEAAARAQEGVELLPHEAVVALGRTLRTLDEEVCGQGSRLEALIDPLAVHRVDEACGVTHGDPAGAVAATRRQREAPGTRLLEIRAE